MFALSLDPVGVHADGVAQGLEVQDIAVLNAHTPVELVVVCVCVCGGL